MPSINVIPDLDKASPIKVTFALKSDSFTSPSFRQLPRPRRDEIADFVVLIVIKYYYPISPGRDFVLWLSNIVENVREVEIMSEANMPIKLKRMSRNYRGELEGWINDIRDLRIKVRKNQLIKIATYEMTEILKMALGLSERKLCRVISSLLHEFNMELKEDNGPEAIRSRLRSFKNELKEFGPYPSAIIDKFQRLTAESPQK